jgi:hypothetical protein
LRRLPRLVIFEERGAVRPIEEAIMFIVRTSRCVGFLAAAGLLAGASAIAQDYDDGRFRDHGPIVYASGGGFSTFADITNRGLNFDTGYNFGAGVGYQLSRNVAVRATFAYTRAELQRSTAGAQDFSVFEGQDFDKYFYGADVELRYLSRAGLAPYMVLGGGAVTVDPHFAAMSSFTKPAGKVGVGLGYTFPHSGASLFAEWDGWIYKWDRDTQLLDTVSAANNDKTQFDTTWSGGLRFVF